MERREEKKEGRQGGKEGGRHQFKRKIEARFRSNGNIKDKTKEGGMGTGNVVIMISKRMGRKSKVRKWNQQHTGYKNVSLCLTFLSEYSSFIYGLLCFFNVCWFLAKALDSSAAN